MTLRLDGRWTSATSTFTCAIAHRPRLSYRRWFRLATKRSDDEITFMTGDRDFLFALMDDPAPAPVPPWFHFGIRLDSAGDVRDTLVAMQAAGVPIVKPLYEDDTF
ncbi:MAG TPA: VOC family protein, partial [Burkholderiales bacterium]|nr:VOC family protein [Burkholderiales bacterium]